MEEKKLLTIQDVARITGLSVGTLYHWVSQKRIPVVRLSSRCVRFRYTDIEQWLAEKVVPPQNTKGSVTGKREKRLEGNAA